MINKPTILIADDDPGYCALLRWFFEDEGWNVIVVANAEDLIKRALDADVLLVDAMLTSSGHDGIAAIASLRQCETSWPLTGPVVFFSELDESESPVELKPRHGRFLWLRKPCLMATVDATVRKAMERNTNRTSNCGISLGPMAD